MSLGSGSSLSRCDVPAYDQVKVWTVDPVRPRAPKGPPPRREPSTRQKIAGTRQRIASAQQEMAERWSRPAERALTRFVWKDEYGVWARFGVVATLATAMLWWPYGRSCGFGLALYLTSSTMIIVGGIWVVACTWILRMPRTHALAVVVTLWGAALITAQVLPRVGYAANVATWMCGSG